MEYDFLKQFSKRMKIVGMFSTLIKNSWQKTTWKQFGFETMDEQVNMIYAVLLFIMEYSLREQPCTIDDISVFVDDVCNRYLKKSLSSEKGTERFTFSPNGRATISFTHSKGNANSWGIHAICLRTLSMVDLSSNVSPTRTDPSFKGTNPITAFSNEVFPQPDCPTIQAVSPLSSFILKPEKSTSVPKAIQALLICSIAFLILSLRQRYYFLEKRYLCLTN